MLNIAGLRLPMLADRIITGDVYFLGSAASDAQDLPSHGSDPRKPFATIDYALSKMTAGQGDYLIVLPGHTESVTQSIDVAGIHIMGVVCGGLTPTFRGSSTADCISIDADDVEFNGFRFGTPVVDAVTANINIGADSAVVKNIYSSACSGDTTYNVVDVFSLDAEATNCLIDGVQLWNTTAPVVSWIHFVGTSSNVTIKNFNAFGTVATGGIIDTAKVTFLHLENVNIAVTGTTIPAVSLGSNPEGVAINCYFGSTSATIAAGCALGNLMRCKNVETTNDVDNSTSAFLWPGIDASS